MGPAEDQQAAAEQQQIHDRRGERAVAVENGETQAEGLVRQLEAGVEKREGRNPDQALEEELHGVDHQEVEDAGQDQQDIGGDGQEAGLDDIRGAASPAGTVQRSRRTVSRVISPDQASI